MPCKCNCGERKEKNRPARTAGVRLRKEWRRDERPRRQISVSKGTKIFVHNKDQAAALPLSYERWNDHSKMPSCERGRQRQRKHARGRGGKLSFKAVSACVWGCVHRKEVSIA